MSEFKRGDRVLVPGGVVDNPGDDRRISVDVGGTVRQTVSPPGEPSCSSCGDSRVISTRMGYGPDAPDTEPCPYCPGEPSLAEHTRQVLLDAVAQHAPGEPSCPKCGYTQRDQEIHGDHHLCDGKIPGEPSLADLVDQQVGVTGGLFDRPWYDDKRVAALVAVVRSAEATNPEAAARLREALDG